MAGKRRSGPQEAFLVLLLEEGTLGSIPYRMVMSAVALEREGLVENTGIVRRLTARGKIEAKRYKAWQENPELRPKRGGHLRKGRISAPLHHGSGDD